MHISLFLSGFMGDTTALTDEQVVEVNELVEQYDNLIQHLRHASALDVLSQLLAVFPTHEKLLIRCAYLNHELYGDYQASVAILGTILDANPSHEEALTLRSELNGNSQSNFETIISDATALLALTPDVTNIFALYHRARAYVLSKQIGPALEDLNQLLSNPAFLFASEHRIMRINLRYDRAQMIYQQYQLIENEEQLEEVMQELNLIIDTEYARDPADENFDKALLFRSQIYGKQNMPALELEDLNRYLNRHPRAVDVLKRRIDVNTALGNNDQVVLDKYTLYKATHMLTKLQKAEAVLLWADNQTQGEASSGKKRTLDEAMVGCATSDDTLVQQEDYKSSASF